MINWPINWNLSDVALFSTAQTHSKNGYGDEVNARFHISTYFHLCYIWAEIYNMWFGCDVSDFSCFLCIFVSVCVLLLSADDIQFSHYSWNRNSAVVLYHVIFSFLVLSILHNYLRHLLVLLFVKKIKLNILMKLNKCKKHWIRQKNKARQLTETESREKIELERRERIETPECSHLMVFQAICSIKIRPQLIIASFWFVVDGIAESTFSFQNNKTIWIASKVITSPAIGFRKFSIWCYF